MPNKDIELHIQKECSLKQKKRAKKRQKRFIIYWRFSQKPVTTAVECWWQLLPFAKFEWFIHAFNWKPQTWKMGSDFPKAHTATRAKLASHKIIQQNSDQNLPLRNICLIKSGLHHSNCIFSRFQFQAWRNHDSSSKAYDILFQKETHVKGFVVSAVIIWL